MIKTIKTKNSGITLIALVVTIIVLIILAGIAIAALLGDNGIITRAEQAKESQRGATVQDEVTLAIAENVMIDQLNSVKGTKEQKKTKADVVNELVTKGYLTSDDETTLETEDTITIGSVMIDFSKLGSAEIEYSYDNPYIPTNFTYKEGTWNSGFTIIGDAGTTNENDEFVWVPCVTSQAQVKSGDIVQTLEKHFSSETEETDPDYEDAEHKAYGGTDVAEQIGEVGTSASAIQASVEVYGGFYISKYEAGVNGTTDNYSLSSKMPTDGSVKPLSQADKGVWNDITRTNAITVAEAMIPSSTGYRSALISGACWDTTMQWIKQTTNTNYDVNSIGKGNYTSDLELTCYYEVNGIYDMAGNVAEWETENYYTPSGSTYPISRGGCFWSSDPAGSRSIDSDSTCEEIGFRVVLYKFVTEGQEEEREELAVAHEVLDYNNGSVGDFFMAPDGMTFGDFISQSDPEEIPIWIGADGYVRFYSQNLGVARHLSRNNNVLTADDVITSEAPSYIGRPIPE